MTVLPWGVVYQGGRRRPVAIARGAAAGRLRAWLPLLCDFFLPLIAIPRDYTEADPEAGPPFFASRLPRRRSTTRRITIVSSYSPYRGMAIARNV